MIKQTDRQTIIYNDKTPTYASKTNNDSFVQH